MFGENGKPKFTGMLIHQSMSNPKPCEETTSRKDPCFNTVKYLCCETFAESIQADVNRAHDSPKVGMIEVGTATGTVAIAAALS